MPKQTLCLPLQVIWEVEISKLSGCLFWFFVIVRSPTTSHIWLDYTTELMKSPWQFLWRPLVLINCILSFSLLPYSPDFFLSSLPGKKTRAKLPLRKDLPVYRVWQSLLSSWQAATPHAPTFRPERFPVFYMWKAI